MHILLIFLDGIGLGDDNPNVNPFAVANTPTLHTLSNGKRWLRDTGHQTSKRAVFVPTDPRLGVAGRPQSGSSQAAILTGRNIPQLIGEHYGPKPNEATRKLLAEGNFFKELVTHDKRTAIINAYPPHLLHEIKRGKRLPSSIQLALLEAGIPLFTSESLYSRDALSEDWTGQGWRTHLGFTDSPVYTPYEAGVRMIELSRRYDFAFFSHWITDTIGHRGTLEDAVSILELFDEVMAGALSVWDDSEGLIVITSDHGNMEEIGSRKHTENDVPTAIIGEKRHEFAEDLVDLTGLVPRMRKLLLPVALS
jgi:2,3-bisphosphoglycerate-independent phosphoglycerate mutase